MFNIAMSLDLDAVPSFLCITAWYVVYERLQHQLQLALKPVIWCEKQKWSRSDAPLWIIAFWQVAEFSVAFYSSLVHINL